MKDLFKISGKVALVTGGSRGIGEMIATGFIENGVKVYISARKADACIALAAELSKKGECIAIPADLSEVSEIERLTAEITKRESKLDILVNNAGAAWGAPFEEFPETGWDKVMDINVKSPFFLTQKLFPLLKKAATYEDPARVINIASVNGIAPGRGDNFSYTASKAGCIMLTRHMAARLTRENILVNAIAPGPFQSQMMRATLAAAGDMIAKSNPRGRIGTPEDIAGVAIFLCSRAAAYTAGATIPCDGGSAEF